jgi:hypothetical protein
MAQGQQARSGRTALLPPRREVVGVLSRARILSYEGHGSDTPRTRSWGQVLGTGPGLFGEAQGFSREGRRGQRN